VRRALVAIVAGTALVAAAVARAETRQASVGNFYFEDDATGDRTRLVVNEGDQVTFTVRQGAATPHTVDVDELDIHSGDLRIGQTYTTPALDTPGNFNLYCRRHEERGHRTRLIVRAPTGATPKPTPRPTRTAVATTAPLPARIPTATPATTASPTPPPSASLAPVGIGTAPPGWIARRTPDPDSLEALTGVRRSYEIPWTRAVWWLLIATVPIAAAAAFALRRNAILGASAAAAAARAEAEAAAAAERAPARKRKPRPKRKPR
jgi:plastocyanin